MSSYYTVAEFLGVFGDKDNLADQVVNMYTVWQNQRAGWLAEKEELRNFLFATDTQHTISESTPWKNRTTLPKLCQLRDNLHANYEAALFPNDDWLKWEGYSQDDEVLQKKRAIQAYMGNKARESGLRSTVSQLLFDYIDYGIAIADVIWVNERKTDPKTGEQIPGYVGPKAIRRSPLDVVFDPTATDFRQTTKITRSVLRMGELERLAMDGDGWVVDTVQWAKDCRRAAANVKAEDLHKATALSVDGFGNLSMYYNSGYVELLEAEGSFYDVETGEVLDDYIITVLDRTKIVRKEPIPSWKRGGMKVFTTWRKRPDNLYGMGPLDNLVGMQYRLDHLENAKADAWDLVITPMFKIKGNVEEFDFEPGGQVQMDEQGDIEPLAVPTAALSVNNEISVLMMWMEEFAGAPKQAMGIRTPGEKTAFEVQSLENAAGRIFQQKITQFEIELLEPLMNNMLMTAAQNINTSTEIIRVMDDDLGVTDFLTITKQDITAAGVIRPIGARHFASRAQLIQNLAGITNSGMWPKIERHFSDKALARLIEDSMQLSRFTLVGDNVSLMEQAEAQQLMQQINEDLAVQQATPGLEAEV